MRRIVLGGTVALVVVGLAAVFYFQFGISPEGKRERHREKAREYLTEGKIKEGVVELRNALKADPASAEAHYELGFALLKVGDMRAAFREFVRASDLKPDWIEPRIQLGNMYVLGRDLAKAKEQLKAIREKDPNVVEGYSLAARIAMAEKKPDEAMAEAKGAITRDPKRPVLYLELGNLQALQRDFKGAEESFRKVLELQPSFHRARISLSNLYLATGNQVKAEEELLYVTKADPENEQLLHVLGNFYSRTRQFDDYEKLYQDILQKKPDSIVAKKRMAELFLAKGDVKQAKVYTEAILKAQPGDVDGHFFQGRIYLIEKNHPKALEEFNTVTRGSPRFAPGFYYLGVAQFRSHQIQQAKTSTTKASELSPLWLEPHVLLAQLHLLAGDHQAALQESEKVLQAQPKHLAMLTINAVASTRSGQFNRAQEQLKKAIAIDPKSPTPHINLGTIYVLQKRPELALKEYEQALNLDPNRLEALGSIGGILMTQGNRKGAVERVEQHLKKTDNPAGVYQILGQLSLAERNYPKSIEYLQKAVDIKPDQLANYFLIGNAYAAQGKFEDAIKQYEGVAKKNPGSVSAQMLLGILYDQKKDYNKANEYYQRALDLNKNFAAAANNLAWNYAEHGGNLDVALGLAQRAREMASENPFIADTLGWIYYKKGAYPTAVGLLNESNEKLDRKNPGVLYHLGMAYYKSGEKDKAREALNQALKLNPNFPGAEEAKKIAGG